MDITTTPPSSTIRLDDGRVVAVHHHGDRGAPPVVLCHPAPGSGAYDPLPAATAGVHLIAVDRAGYGGSDPLPEGATPTVVGAADDLAATIDALDLEPVVLVGWSAGGRVAAALAARRPELVRRMWIVGTPAPDEDVPWLDPAQRDMIAEMAADPAASVGRLAAMMAPMAAAPGRALVGAGPADEGAVADDPELGAAVDAMVAVGLRDGTRGLAGDVIAGGAVPWGFDPAAVGAPSTLVYGGRDPIVPPAHGRWWAGAIPGAALQVVADGGHLLLHRIWSDVVGAARR